MAAALYLAAGIGAVLGLTLPSPRVLRGARWGLGLGAVAQAVGIGALHRLDPAPSLTSLSMAVAVMAWLSVVFTLALLPRWRLQGFVPPLAFIAFLAAFGTTLSPGDMALEPDTSGSLPHAHVLLSSAGLAALGVAGLAGFFFLVEHRALKRRRRIGRRIALPSLEALDWVNRLALVLGFPLLTLGVMTGSLWLHSQVGQLFSGNLHEIWTAVAWIIYVGLIGLRFAGHQGARQAAASALAGFAFLLLAVVGSGLVS